MPESQLKRLYDLLEHERMALTHADFAALTALTAEKESVLGALTEMQLPQADMQAIADQITRNQTLLAAAMKGVKSAQTTVAGLHKSGATTNVYGRNGEVSRLGSAGEVLSQKL